MDPSLQIGLLILGLVVAWILVRFIMRLTRRIFTFGCAMIVLLGLVVVYLAYWR